jgi:tetratricopeptide (TPR) repeat protein
MQTQIDKKDKDIFKQLSNIVAAAFVFLLPLIFSTNTSNVFDIPKKALLFAAALAILGIWTTKSLVKNKLKINITPFTLPLVGLAIISLISSFATEGHFIANLYGKTGVFLAIAIIFTSITSIAPKKLNSLLYSIIGASFIVSWVLIFAYLEVLPKIIPWPMASSKAFSPAGSPLTSTSFLAIVLPVTLFIAVKTKDNLIKTVLFVSSAVQAVALIFLVSLMLPGQPFEPALLPFSAGWSITVDMLKNAKSALLGIGPDNFIAAYTRFKPISMNLNEKLWAVRFAASSNELFTIATTLGILGLISFMWLIASVVKTVIDKTSSVKPEVKLGLAFTFLVHLAIPANLLVWLTTLVFLSLASKGLPKKTIRLEGKDNAFVPKLVNFITLAVALVGFYALSRFIRADLAFAKSLKTASENKGTETYNLQIQTLKLNPYELVYRNAYSNTNLALANSIAGKEELTEEDKASISQLVSQSIREAKTTVALNPKNVSSWENLSIIYRNLINFAQGADQWAIASYVEAIKLDPIDPRLRLDLGGLFYSLGNYDQALDQFKRAVDFKPNYANAYYNLSAAHKAKGDYINSFLAMQKVVEFIDKDSQDFDKVNVELAELKKMLPEELQTATQAATKKPGELQKPQPIPQNPSGRVNFSPEEQKNLAPPEPEPIVPPPSPELVPSPIPEEPGPEQEPPAPPSPPPTE